MTLGSPSGRPSALATAAGGVTRSISVSDQALGAKNLDRSIHVRLGDAVAGRQLCLRRQRGTGRVLASLDRLAQQVGELPVLRALGLKWHELLPASCGPLRDLPEFRPLISCT